jgi:phosphoglycolate phosphatase
VFVGDSEVDEATARAAGVPFVAYRNPALEANWHIESLKDLEGFLQSSGTA